MPIRRVYYSLLQPSRILWTNHNRTTTNEKGVRDESKSNMGDHVVRQLRKIRLRVYLVSGLPRVRCSGFPRMAHRHFATHNPACNPAWCHGVLSEVAVVLDDVHCRILRTIGYRRHCIEAHVVEGL